MRSFFLIAWCLVLTIPTGIAADFEEDVAPLLIRRCLECHKGAEPSGGLSLETRAGLLKGGESGKAVSAEQPDQSLLLERIVSGEMPPPVKGVSQHLPETERAILADWIRDGAKWPDQRRLDLYEITTDVRGGRDWWSFQPLTRPTIPDVAEQNVRNPIDAFVLAQLTEQGMTPAAPASAETIVRRMYYDVIGLPPSLDELTNWSRQLRMSGTAAALADHLLSMPQSGERRARYWLDLVRYAETSGYERDQPKPFAWKYRDWVVNAINNDMPYDQFIRHQIAGDEISERTEQSVIATGFLRLGTWNDEPNDNADYLYDRLEDMVHTTSSAFLGLTVKCARCHDHKFDPIPQHDYYRMASVFWPGPVAARDRKLLGGPSADELKVKDVLGWTDLTSTPPVLHVLKDGERQKPMHAAEPGSLTFAPAFFRKFLEPEAGARTSGRRRQLADWIAHKKNPLTARVFVNRLWQYHFGEGLVRSPNNFGYKGEPPTHPKLLDWLAVELMENGWSARHIDRLILTSSTWQQSSLHPSAAEYNLLDSTNRLWWRANRRRLDAEALRDSMLAVSGEIDLRVGGEGFKPTISEEALEGFSRKSSVWKAAPPEQQRRRSLYIFVSRSLMPPMMTTFDQSDTTLPCAQRNVTTVAPQALAMMNNHFTHDRSAALAARVKVAATSVDEQIAAAFRFALARNASAEEIKLARQHVDRMTTRFENPEVLKKAAASVVVPAPVLRLSADSGVGKTDSGRVTLWKAATGQAAAQSENSARPVYVTVGINGRPALYFDGVGRFMTIAGDVISDAGCTIVAVADDRAVQSGLREIISNWNGSAGNSTSSVFLGLRDRSHVRFSDQFSPAGEIINRNKPFVISAVSGPDGTRVWQNAGLIGSRSQPLTGRRFDTQWVIGQQGNINGEFWHGHIAQILVFDSPLSQPQLETVWEELHSRYNIPRLKSQPPDEETVASADRALASLCHVLLNSNEFLYVD